MERRLGLIGLSCSAHGQASLGVQRQCPLKFMLANFVAHCESYVHHIKTVVWRLRFYVVIERENYTVTLCIFSLRIVKSVQLYGCRIFVCIFAEPRKYYLVCD